MSVQIDGYLHLKADDALPHEIGVDLAAFALRGVLSQMLEKMPVAAQEQLVLGLLAGTVGHFRESLSIERLHKALNRCQAMVQEVPGFMPEAQLHAAGKAVH